MAVYARRSRTRHKPAWRAKQRGPEAEHEREYQASRTEPRRQDVDPVEPVGTPETNQPRDEGTPRK